jgi:hypothetical protein
VSWKRSTGDSRLDEIVDGIVAAFPAEPLPKFDQIVGKVGPMDFEKKETTVDGTPHVAHTELLFSPGAVLEFYSR